MGSRARPPAVSGDAANGWATDQLYTHGSATNPNISDVFLEQAQSAVTAITIQPALDAQLALQLHRLQRDAYRVEAELIGVSTIPPLHETLPELLQNGLHWLGEFSDGTDRERPAHRRVLCGALAWSARNGTLEIERLVVSPAHFRRGIARRLLQAAVAGAAGRSVVVCTGRDNGPARHLYERSGFKLVQLVQPAPGVHLAQYILHP